MIDVEFFIVTPPLFWESATNLV